MPTVVAINRPDVVALIEQAAERLTGGNQPEAVSLAIITRIGEQRDASGGPPTVARRFYFRRPQRNLFSC